MKPDRGVKRSSDDFRRNDWELRAARAYLTNYQTSDSVSNSIIRLAAEGDVDGIVSLIDTGGLNAAQQALAKSLLQRLRSTAQQIIAKECQASIHREFPRELYSTRLKDIIQMAKRGDDAARRALKLLNDKRFKKGR